MPTNLGTGGSVLDAQAGSTSGADTNDPKFLSHDGTNYVYLPGVAGNYLSTPDAAALDITGDLTLTAYVAADDWTPAANQTLGISKWGASGQRSWRWQLNTAGTMTLVVTADGTNNTVAAVSTAAPTVADGAGLWVRATFDADNGASGNDVKFYTSPDGVTWTQLGSTVTTAGTVAILAGTSVAEIGTTGIGAANLFAGKVYRAIVATGLHTDSVPVLDVDTSVITSGAATSFTATTGQTVTINRSTSGRKSVAVVAPVWLLGTDDYFEVADNDALDFAAGDSFTVLAVHRSWATLGTNDALVAKKANTTATTAGWALTAGSSTAAQGQLQAGDGTAGATAVSGSRTSGALAVVAGVRNVAADTLTVYLNGTAGTPVEDTTTDTSANAEVVRIGRLSGAGTEYADAEVVAAAVWRRALTADEIAAVTAYYQARIGA